MITEPTTVPAEPLCKRCGAHHPPTFLWRERERPWHENVPEPRSVRR